MGTTQFADVRFELVCMEGDDECTELDAFDLNDEEDGDDIQITCDIARSETQASIALTVRDGEDELRISGFRVGPDGGRASSCNLDATIEGQTYRGSCATECTIDRVQFDVTTREGVTGDSIGFFLRCNRLQGPSRNDFRNLSQIGNPVEPAPMQIVGCD